MALSLPPPSSAASAAITNHLFPLIGADFFHSLSRAPTFPRFLSLSDRESDIEESWGHAHRERLRERPTDIQRNPPISIFIRFIYVLRSSSHFPIYRTTEERSRSSRAFRSIVLLGASLIYSNESNNERTTERTLSGPDTTMPIYIRPVPPLAHHSSSMYFSLSHPSIRTLSISRNERPHR